MRFHDSEPDRIVSTTMERDAFLEESDFVELEFDTFLDRRNAFFFQVNPSGSKGDALVSNNGADFNKPWDGIWDAATRTDDGGWTAELALPFKTFNFPPGFEAWGFNVQRFIGRKREIARWSGAKRDYSLHQVYHAGDLVGFEGIKQGIGLDVAPFVVGDWWRDRTLDDTDSDFDAGLDAFYKITSNLNLSLTVNTDFAETEVDERRINLTRFPLFFPERRDFFLQDAGLFQFQGTGGSVRPFFSRTIGLSDDGEEVPITFGAKLTGRAGDYNVGVLDVLTDEHRTDAGEELDDRNLFVARVSRNVGERSTIGGIVTHGDPLGDTDGPVYGTDLNFSSSTFLDAGNFNAGAWGLVDDSDDSTTEDAAFGVHTNAYNDVWSWYGNAREIQRDFDPPLGFVPRRNIRNYRGGVHYSPRVDETIRQLEFGLDASLTTDTDDRIETVFGELQPIGIYWESGLEARLEIDWTREDLTEGFTVNDVDIPAGDYDFARYRLELETPRQREVVSELTLQTGGFFGGDLDGLEVELLWKPDAYFNGSVEYEYNDASLPSGDFTTHLVRARTDVSFTPNLSWNTFAQWDDVSDTVGINSRLRWIPAPGRDVFLVFNETLDARGGSVSPAFQGFSVKLAYTFRL